MGAFVLTRDDDDDVGAAGSSDPDSPEATIEAFFAASNTYDCYAFADLVTERFMGISGIDCSNFDRPEEPPPPLEVETMERTDELEDQISIRVTSITTEELRSGPSDADTGEVDCTDVVADCGYDQYVEEYVLVLEDGAWQIDDLVEISQERVSEPTPTP